MSDIKNRNLEQLEKYAKWERDHFPGGDRRIHVLEWAIEEIKRLRLELNRRDGSGGE